ncbi:MAG: glycosyltransferase family 2 protein, partial [Candidatus Heimdallarchaeaceae archaeon]
KLKQESDKRIHLIHHKKNVGPGGAIITGYLKSSEMNNDITVVIGGDNQMDQSEMYKIIDPIIDGKADYTKGNRFLVDAFEVMPFKRVIGNISLSILTVLCAGTFHIFDTQDGYTAISKEVIDKVDWDIACHGYGYVSDFIIRIATYGFRILDVPRRSIYLPGVRQSQIVIGKYIKRIFPILFNALKWKLEYKFAM